MTTTFKPWLAVGLAAALVLAAGCSGSSSNDAGNNSGGDSSPGDSASIPDSAGTSVAGFLAYLLALSPNDESSEPLLIKDNFSVPVDEGSDSQSLS